MALTYGYIVVPLCFLVYCVVDGLVTRKLIRKQAEKPFVGSPFTLTPRFILNILFASKAAAIVERGYRKFKHQAFQIVRNDGHVILLPLTVLEELSNIPTAVASPNGALEHDLLGRFTGLNLILESRAHHSIVQRRLTPRLGLMTSGLEKEIGSACDEFLAAGPDWVEFQPYQALSKVSSRIAAQAIVTPDFSHNPTWLDISVQYTENLFQTIVIVRLFPTWMQSLICHLLPSFWHGRRYMRDAKQLLSPRIQEMLHAHDEGTWKPQPNERDSNVLSWLVETVRGRDRNADTLAHVEVLLALAAVHTTLLRMVNVLYDITEAGTSLAAELQAEIQDVARQSGQWGKSSYDRLHKLDSVLRESQRMSPPTTLGLKRLFCEDYTFQNGLHIPKGTYTAMPIHAIENDPAHTPNPEVFDGLRNYRLLSEQQALDSNEDTRQFLFSTPGRTVLNFGYGRHACPGRHFASLVLKVLFVKLLTEYEFKFMPGSERPQNLMAHEFLFTWPWDRMLMRRKAESTCPF